MSNTALCNLSPKILWEAFDGITRVPRPSKHEEQIIQYLLDFAHKHSIEVHKDAAGNLLMRKPATPGYENRKSIVLQSHIDMVTEKNAGTEHDFMRDPIQTYIDGDWVKAKGTTLGADDGIGVAAQLAILIDDTIEHGPIECLFTVDEETGLTGAFALEEGFFNSKILLNLDSEDEGEIFIGCAGGVDTIGELPVHYVSSPNNSSFFRLDVKGLKGGHSGDDIHKGHANAIKLLVRTLDIINRQVPIDLVRIEGGNLRNAIAREAYAVFAFDSERAAEIEQVAADYAKALQFEYRSTEPLLQIALSPSQRETKVLSLDSQRMLIFLLYGMPHGVLEMSREIPGFVETSTNLVSVKQQDASTFLITTSQRSSVESAKQMAAVMVENLFRLAGATFKHSDGYPGWAPDPNSEILRISEELYTKRFQTKPIVRAIHAGLECGLFLKKYPNLDMISFGPTIRGAHSPDERLQISSVVKFWDFLLDILKHAPTTA